MEIQFFFVFSQIIPVGYNHVIFKKNEIIMSVFVMLVNFSLFGCRIFFVEGTRSILLGVKSMPCIYTNRCIVQFEQVSCDVFASHTESLQ